MACVAPAGSTFCGGEPEDPVEGLGTEVLHRGECGATMSAWRAASSSVGCGVPRCAHGRHAGGPAEVLSAPPALRARGRGPSCRSCPCPCLCPSPCQRPARQSPWAVAAGARSRGLLRDRRGADLLAGLSAHGEARRLEQAILFEPRGADARRINPIFCLSARALHSGQSACVSVDGSWADGWWLLGLSALLRVVADCSGHGVGEDRVPPAYAVIANRKSRQLVCQPSKDFGRERARESNARAEPADPPSCGPASRPAACACMCAPIATTACCMPASACITGASDACKRALQPSVRPRGLPRGLPRALGAWLPSSVMATGRRRKHTRPWAVACFAPMCGTPSLHRAQLSVTRSLAYAASRTTPTMDSRHHRPQPAVSIGPMFAPNGQNSANRSARGARESAPGAASGNSLGKLWFSQLFPGRPTAASKRLGKATFALSALAGLLEDMQVIQLDGIFRFRLGCPRSLQVEDVAKCRSVQSHHAAPDVGAGRYPQGVIVLSELQALSCADTTHHPCSFLRRCFDDAAGRQDPVYLLMTFTTMLPIFGIRVFFFMGILVMLLFPGPPDEFQLINFILIFKGTQARAFESVIRPLSPQTPCPACSHACSWEGVVSANY